MLPRRTRPPRHPEFDYAASGWYFVTVCTAGRRRLFAERDGSALRVTRAGMIATAVWYRTPQVDPRVRVDRFVVMPDHVHGILVLDGLETGRRTLSTIVGTFKPFASREIREEIPSIGRIWQRSFHDRIIRSGRELQGIRRYIEDNPARWIADHSDP